MSERIHAEEIKRWATSPEGTPVWRKSVQQPKWSMYMTPSWDKGHNYILDDEYAELRKALVDGKTVYLKPALKLTDSLEYFDDYVSSKKSEADEFTLEPLKPPFKVDDCVTYTTVPSGVSMASYINNAVGESTVKATVSRVGWYDKEMGDYYYELDDGSCLPSKILSAYSRHLPTFKVGDYVTYTFAKDTVGVALIKELNSVGCTVVLTNVYGTVITGQANLVDLWKPTDSEWCVFSDGGVAEAAIARPNKVQPKSGFTTLYGTLFDNCAPYLGPELDFMNKELKVGDTIDVVDVRPSKYKVLKINKVTLRVQKLDDGTEVLIPKDSTYTIVTEQGGE